VGHVAGYRRVRARVTGAARRSGTPPRRWRRDALAAASEMALAAESLAREAGEPAVATAGFAHAAPGLFNVVPGACELALEVRHVQAEALDRLAAELERRCRAIADGRGVDLTWEQVSHQDPVALSVALANLAAEMATELRVPHRRMASGAAHDTMVFARAGVPALMLFVPSQGGVSHAPEEHTDAAALATGYRLAAAFARRVAEHVPGPGA